MHDSVVLSNRLSRWASKSETKEHVSMPAGPEAKESPGFFNLMAFFRSPNIFSLWFSADSRTQKLHSEKFDQWRRRMWMNMYQLQYRRSFSHKVTTRRFSRSILPWRRAPDQRQRSAGRYIYIYISWQKAKSTRNCGARLRLAPIKFRTFSKVLGKCKALWGKPRTLWRLSQRSTELSCRRLMMWWRKIEKIKGDWRATLCTFFLHEHISPRTSLTVVRVRLSYELRLELFVRYACWRACQVSLSCCTRLALANEKEGERWRKVKTTTVVRS